MAMQIIEITENVGSVQFGTPYTHLFILNRGSVGTLVINGTEKIDISTITAVDGVEIHKIAWSLSMLDDLKIIVADHFVTPRDLHVSLSESKLMRIFSKEQPVYDGTPVEIALQPPEGKMYIVKSVSVKYEPYNDGTTDLGNLVTSPCIEDKYAFYYKMTADNTLPGSDVTTETPYLVKAVGYWPNYLSIEGNAIINSTDSIPYSGKFGDLIATEDNPLYLSIAQNIVDTTTFEAEVGTTATSFEAGATGQLNLSNAFVIMVIEEVDAL